MKVIIFIRDLFRKFPFLLTANTLLIVVESLIGIAAIFTIAPIIDFIVNPGVQNTSPITNKVADVLRFIGLPVTLSSFLAVFLSLQLLKSGFTVFVRYSLLRTKYVVLGDLMVGTFADFFRARWIFFTSSRQGTLANTFAREIAVVGDAFGAMSLLCANFLQLIFYLAVPLYLSWQVTSISLATALLVASPILLLGKLNYRLGQLNTSTANQVLTVIQESLGSAKLILGFGNHHKSIHDLSRAYDAHARAMVKSQTLAVSVPVVYEPLGVLMLVVAVFTSRIFSVPLSEMGVILWALIYTIPLVSGLVTRKNSLENFFPSYEQVKELKQQAMDLAQPSGKLPFTGFYREVAVENLTFAYPGQEPILTNINLRIPKGKMTALVGESGGGKTTLVDMLLGLHEPLAGRITIDGVPFPEFDILSFRRRVGYVPQDAVLFNITIRDNLRWANETATEEEIRAACQLANADEFIERFPDGYDTLVGDRGVRLSGGQCQRVALARAILRRPQLLILDEATSSLDSHSESLIQRAMENIAKETTVIVVAHRLSTIVNANYIYVVDNGRIVEEGTYRALVQENGHFSRMANLQVLEGTVSRE